MQVPVTALENFRLACEVLMTLNQMKSLPLADVMCLEGEEAAEMTENMHRSQVEKIKKLRSFNRRQDLAERKSGKIIADALAADAAAAGNDDSAEDASDASAEESGKG